MIACRKPFTIYDVDVIGLAALGVVGLAACVGVILPARANVDEYASLRVQIASAQEQAEQTGARLRRVQSEAQALEDGVSDRAHAAPGPGDLTPFLHRVASLALACDVEINQVVPRPMENADGYLAADVWFSGRAAALRFAELLDRVTREVPFVTLKDVSIGRAPDPAETACEICWTLRLHMLEGEAPQAIGK